MTRKPLRKFLPLTYPPKIAAVQEGTCTQSIRIDTRLGVGDFIAFHGWEGRPYHSSWSFRTPYYPIILAKPINLHKNYVYLPEEKRRLNIGDPLLDRLAEKDGIEPATGEELLRVLHAMHKIRTFLGNQQELGKIERSPAQLMTGNDYESLHKWARINVQKPDHCPECHKIKKLVIHNINKTYLKEPSGWIWLCQECHRIIESKSQNRSVYKQGILYGKVLRWEPIAPITVSLGQIEQAAQKVIEDPLTAVVSRCANIAISSMMPFDFEQKAEIAPLAVPVLQARPLTPDPMLDQVVNHFLKVRTLTRYGKEQQQRRDIPAASQ